MTKKTRIYQARIGVTIEFSGTGEDEVGIGKECTDENYQLSLGQTVVAVDPRYYRPTEVDVLIGDAAKAREKLGWTPQYDLDALIDDMVNSDLKAMRKEQFLKNNGYRVLNYFE